MKGRTIEQVRDFDLEEEVKKLYSPSLPYHNFQHVIDTITAAEKIIQRCNTEGTRVDGQVVYLALLFHDAAYHENQSGIYSKRIDFSKFKRKNISQNPYFTENVHSKYDSEVYFVNPKVKTELSLSINGTKQNAVVGCISLKNYEEIKSGSGNVSETLESISNLIESDKGLIYKNHGHLFFILAPVLTKTFKNEETSLKITNKIVVANNIMIALCKFKITI